VSGKEAKNAIFWTIPSVRLYVRPSVRSGPFWLTKSQILLRYHEKKMTSQTHCGALRTDGAKETLRGGENGEYNGDLSENWPDFGFKVD
jgi:hypothetical protein